MDAQIKSVEFLMTDFFFFIASISHFKRQFLLFPTSHCCHSCDRLGSPALYIGFSLCCDSRAVAELFSRLILDGHNYFTNPILENVDTEILGYDDAARVQAGSAS